MPADARCACGHVFEVADDLIGGIVNCPSCGKAVEVEGLRDPWWRLIVGFLLVVWALTVAVMLVWVGPLYAIVVALGMGAVFWVLTRAL